MFITPHRYGLSKPRTNVPTDSRPDIAIRPGWIIFQKWKNVKGIQSIFVVKIIPICLSKLKKQYEIVQKIRNFDKSP
jgi:hypothetical protein